MSTVADILNGAADLIERYGLAQRDYGCEATGYCISGAIDTAAGGEKGTAEDDDALIARFVVADIVNDSWITYNDTPGRTQAEVVATLRAAAEQAS